MSAPVVRLDPELATVIAAVDADREAKGITDIADLTPEFIREDTGPDNPLWTPHGPEMQEVWDLAIPGPGGLMTLRLFDPGLEGPAPGMLFLHGGGWVLGWLGRHDGICAWLAKTAGIRVASLDYRLAPEHKFPAALEDTVAAARWLKENGAEYGFDPDRLAVGGDSAGANLALSALTVLRDTNEPVFKLASLIYGVFSADSATLSHRAFGGGEYILGTELMDWFWDHYLMYPAQRWDPRAAPLYADLHRLPPLHIYAAEMDPLLDDSVALAEKLEVLELPHRFTTWPGTAHAFLHFTKDVAAARTALEQVGRDMAGVL